MLARLFGGDTYTFTSTNALFPGEERVYHSFRECAEECGVSRVYGGIHFSFSNREGLALGRRVANYVADNVFKKPLQD